MYEKGKDKDGKYFIKRNKEYIAVGFNDMTVEEQVEIFKKLYPIKEVKE